MKVIIKKAFMPGKCETFEHIAEMNHTNYETKQQRSVTITVMDINNSFGEETIWSFET